MKSLITFFLLVFLSLQTFAPSMFVSIFYANQQSLTEKYCINKSKPKLHCNGKCYLQKKLNKLNQTDTKENKNHELINITLKFDPFVLFEKAKVATNSTLVSNEFQLYTSQHKPFMYCSSIFHPPSVHC
ncbi:MAG: hypothetical protein V9E96_18255 [Chitinophagaceae bacterium]|jgi:hypothetical protein